MTPLQWDMLSTKLNTLSKLFSLSSLYATVIFPQFHTMALQHQAHHMLVLDGPLVGLQFSNLLREIYETQGEFSNLLIRRAYMLVVQSFPRSQRVPQTSFVNFLGYLSSLYSDWTIAIGRLP